MACGLPVICAVAGDAADRGDSVRVPGLVAEAEDAGVARCRACGRWRRPAAQAGRRWARGRGRRTSARLQRRGRAPRRSRRLLERAARRGSRDPGRGAGGSGFVGAHVVPGPARGEGWRCVPVRAPRLAHQPRGRPRSSRSSCPGPARSSRRRGAARAASGRRSRGQRCWPRRRDARGRRRALRGERLAAGACWRGASPVDARLVHISSAAVQGRRPTLDETAEAEPFSPYSASKALGEAVVTGRRRHGVLPAHLGARPRPRQSPAALARLCASPLASVAGSGDRPTPQVARRERRRRDRVRRARRARRHRRSCSSPWEGSDRRPTSCATWAVASPCTYPRACRPGDRGPGVARGSAPAGRRQWRGGWRCCGSGSAGDWLADARWSPPYGLESWGRTLT